jgi:uncharacterized membrane protein YhaH (DUF805 family)
MQPLALLFSSSGRIARRPFAVAVAGIYLIGFLSQFLLAAPVLAGASFVPFVLVQVLAGWAWTVLHIKRLRDAGRSSGTAVALAIVYALDVVLFLLVIIIMMAPIATGSGDSPASGLGSFLLLFFLIAILIDSPSLGLFTYTLLGVLALFVLPIVLACAFTIWAATRPSVATPA